MANQQKVFISSPLKGMETYRDAVKHAIELRDGYTVINMEKFGARTTTPYETCLAKVKECTLFIGIVGPLYGTQHPSGKSYSELEYEQAIALGKPYLMFLTKDNFSFPYDCRENDELWKRQLAFRERVKAQQVGFFANSAELVALVLAGIGNDMDTAEPQPTKGAITTKNTRLLFPFVTNQAGFDTGITISNVSADPISAGMTTGGVRLFFYGTDPPLNGHDTPPFKDIPPIPAGTVFSGLLSGLAPKFQGYIIAICNFHPARGYAMIADTLFQKIASGYLAEVTEFETEIPYALKAIYR